MADALNAFVMLFIVIDPIGVAWMFAALTAGIEMQRQRHMAIRGVLLAGGIMFMFFFLGDAVLRWMGISLPAFRIAGGILLFLLSLEMMFARQSGLRSTTYGEQYEAEHKQDIDERRHLPLAGPHDLGQRRQVRMAEQQRVRQHNKNNEFKDMYQGQGDVLQHPHRGVLVRDLFQQVVKQEFDQQHADAVDQQGEDDLAAEKDLAYRHGIL